MVRPFRRTRVGSHGDDSWPRARLKDGFPMTSNAMRKAFNHARKRAGLTHFRFHDTRHERISSLIEAGWAMPQVIAQSGHRDPKSVMRFTNLSGDYLAKELAKI